MLLNIKGRICCCFIFYIVSCYTGSLDAAMFNFNGVNIRKDVKTMREIKRENVTVQSLDFSCGAAGMSTLLNYYLNDPVREEDIITYLLNIVPLEKVRARNGFSLLDLKKYALAQGYKVTGYKMDVEFLKALGKPVLVPITFKKYSHFVIVKGIIDDRVFIADPAVGNMSMKIDQFQRIWAQGIGLVVENDKEDMMEYALKIKKEDLLISNYKNMKSLINQSTIRTAVYANEWK